jgi:hypothetical protein
VPKSLVAEPATPSTRKATAILKLLLAKLATIYKSYAKAPTGPFYNVKWLIDVREFYIDYIVECCRNNKL